MTENKKRESFYRTMPAVNTDAIANRVMVKTHCLYGVCKEIAEQPGVFFRPSAFMSYIHNRLIGERQHEKEHELYGKYFHQVVEYHPDAIKHYGMVNESMRSGKHDLIVAILKVILSKVASDQEEMNNRKLHVHRQKSKPFYQQLHQMKSRSRFRK